MTAGELKKALANVPDNYTIDLGIYHKYDQRMYMATDRVECETVDDENSFNIFGINNYGNI